MLPRALLGAENNRKATFPGRSRAQERGAPGAAPSRAARGATTPAGTQRAGGGGGGGTAGHRPRSELSGTQRWAGSPVPCSGLRGRALGLRFPGTPGGTPQSPPSGAGPEGCWRQRSVPGGGRGAGTPGVGREGGRGAGTPGCPRLRGQPRARRGSGAARSQLRSKRRCAAPGRKGLKRPQKKKAAFWGPSEDRKVAFPRTDPASRERADVTSHLAAR